MDESVTQLNRRFGIAGAAEIVEGHGGLPKVHVTTRDAAGDIYLHGAQVTSWRPAGAPDVFFVSTESRWETGRAIRGGIPICFPWFGSKPGDAQAPAHGFVRTSGWQLESVTQEEAGVTVSMSTESGDETRRWWPASFRLVHRVTFGSSLHLDLTVTNRGAATLRLEEALHAYFHVGRVDEVRLRGLENLRYLDKTEANREKIQDGRLAIAAETDRIFLNARDAVEIEDRSLGRRIRIVKEQSATTVVWNPWRQKAQALADLGDDDWMRMVCVEVSNVSPLGIVLEPAREHTMRALITAADL